MIKIHQPVEWNKPVLLVIVGLTASGKTDLAYRLALILNGEIVNADSVSLRKQLDIGADKPSKTMLNNVKHHLINEIELEEKITVYDYQKKAKNIIADIQSRKKIPILVGGSNLYINSIIYDYSFVTNRKVDETLNSFSLHELQTLAKKLKLDIKNVDLSNKVRLINFINNRGQVGSRKRLNKNTLVIGIKAEPHLLKDKIIQRVHKMIDSGLEKEVIKINSELHQLKYLNIIGYKEWNDYFNGLEGLEDVKNKIIKNTFLLMKKQHTWLKNNQDIVWINLSSNMEDIVGIITSRLNK